MPRARVLIVDPVKIDGAILATILAHMDFEVAAVLSVEAGTAQCKQDAFDLVILNEMLKAGPDGRDICFTAKNNRNLPLIYSSSRQASQQYDIQKNNINTIIKKPFRVTTIKKQIDHYFKLFPAGDLDAVWEEHPEPLLDADTMRHAQTLLHQDIALMSDEFHNDDRNGVANVAHRLISLACILGHSDLGRTCQALEEAIRDRGAVHDRFQAVLREIARIGDLEDHAS